MGDITKNFSYSEFRPKASDDKWLPTNNYQKTLLDTLAKNLQVIKDNIPSNISMKVTSGVRDAADFSRLKKLGYKPSITSDHNFGLSTPLEPGTDKYKKYGNNYNFSVGAADVITPGLKIRELFKISFNLCKQGMCDFGQVIYEKNPLDGSEWVHYANDPALFFSKDIVKMLGRQKFSESLDGGKSYQQVLSV